MCSLFLHRFWVSFLRKQSFFSQRQTQQNYKLFSFFTPAFRIRHFALSTMSLNHRGATDQELIRTQLVSWLISWYFEPRQPQRITLWPKTMFSLSPFYSACKSSNHILPKKKKKKISVLTQTHIKQKKYTNIKHKFLKNQSLRHCPC